MNIPNIKLNDGQQIPQIGLGLWQNKDEKEFKQAFDAAIKAGYTHFDSAQAYDNEHYLGEAMKNLRREELFITTKIAVEHFGYNNAHKSFRQSLKNLQTDYVDLLLLHFPVPVLRKKSWQALEEIQKSGGAKSIGVSNYTIKHLEQMKEYAQVMPAVNQVELHIFLQQPELLKYCADNGIIVEAYSPLAHAKDMDNQLIKELAAKYQKSYAQIMLRWCLQQGLVVLPKSVTPARIQENLDILDFEISDTDMQKLQKQDRDLRTCWSPVRVP